MPSSLRRRNGPPHKWRLHRGRRADELNHPPRRWAFERDHGPDVAGGIHSDSVLWKADHTTGGKSARGAENSSVRSKFRYRVPVVVVHPDIAGAVDRKAVRRAAWPDTASGDRTK